MAFDPSTAQPVGSFDPATAIPVEPSIADRLLRQAGLTGRYLTEGAMGIPNMPFDAAVRAYRLLTNSYGPNAPETSTEAQARLMQSAGVPEPKPGLESVVGDISRTLVPVGGQIGTAGRIAETAVNPVTRAVGGLLAQAPKAQAASAVTGALAGDVAGSLGADPLTRYGAGLLGGMSPALAFAPAAVRAAMPKSTFAGDQAARAAAMADVGITNPPLPAVTRSPQDWVTWQELGKREGPARDIFTTAGEQANTQLADFLPGMRAAPESTPYAQSEAARRAVAAYQADAKNVASGTYAAAAKAPGADLAFPAGPFWSQARPIIETFEDSLPGAVKKRLQELQAGGLAGNGELPAASGAAPRDFTVGEAAKLYQLINDTTGTAFGPAKAAGGQLKAALADASATMPGATGTAMQLFKDATEQWRTMKQTLAPTPIKSLSRATEASPNFLTNLFTSGKPGEIASLQGLLQANIPSAADAMHDSLLDYLQGQATRAANGRFSGAMLGKAMDNVGPERLAAVFSPPELSKLNSLRTASEALTVEPNLSTVNRSNTASAIMNTLRKSLPVLGALSGGLLGPEHGIVGAMAGYAAEEGAKRLAGRRMAGMYGLPDAGPTLGGLLQGSVLPWVTGSSVGAASGLGR